MFNIIAAVFNQSKLSAVSLFRSCFLPVQTSVGSAHRCRVDECMWASTSISGGCRSQRSSVKGRTACLHGQRWNLLIWTGFWQYLEWPMSRCVCVCQMCILWHILILYEFNILNWLIWNRRVQWVFSLLSCQDAGCCKSCIILLASVAKHIVWSSLKFQDELWIWTWDLQQPATDLLS